MTKKEILVFLGIFIIIGFIYFAGKPKIITKKYESNNAAFIRLCLEAKQTCPEFTDLNNEQKKIVINYAAETDMTQINVNQFCNFLKLVKKGVK